MKKLLNIQELRESYKKGENISLKLQSDGSLSSEDIIEVSYDLQSGSYTNYVLSNIERANAYALELAQLLDEHLDENDIMLDIGTGEMTTLTLMLSQLKRSPRLVLAFDISWSRIYVGKKFVEKYSKFDNEKVLPFVAEMEHLPCADNSIDVVTSSHALEPNGGKLESILRELFRVTRKKLVLFEPSYENNSKEGKARMDKFGYIKNLADIVESLGGQVLSTTQLHNIANPLNPTYCYVVSVDAARASDDQDFSFSVPGVSTPLFLKDSFYFSEQMGVSFPIIDKIPVLKNSAAILTSALRI
ncbi:MAG: hypothetical protein CME71_12690 [Halobacteriovorax sp.]|nr:hypothetical protein [Halobacteriovorax sp.]|tara:strand:- start:418 stop:1323 length:906 start_codon:yes stop_codon:yes gene_type:complete